MKTYDTIKFLFNFKQYIYDSCFSIHQLWQVQTSVVITIYQNFRHGWRVKRSHIPIAIIDLNNGKDIYVCTKKNSRRIVKLRNPVNPVQAVLNIVLRIVEFYTFLHLYLSLSLSLFEYSIIIIPFVSIAISLTFFSYLTYISVRNSC